MRILLVAFALLLVFVSSAGAQSQFIPCYATGTTTPCQPVDATHGMPTVPGSSSASSAGITPVVCGSAVNNCVLKATPGNLYSVYAECSSACWLMIFNSTAAQSNGSTTAGVAANNMTDCIPIAAGGVG